MTIKHKTGKRFPLVRRLTFGTCGVVKQIATAVGLLAMFGFSSGHAEPMTLKSAAQKAVASNPEVLARYHTLTASEGELEAVTSTLLPHLDFIASRGKQDRHDPLFIGKYTEDSRSLQLTQLLWDGLGSWHQKRQFDHARLVRLFELFDASESAALEVSRAYYDVLRYRKLVELAEDNYVQHRSVYEQIEAKVKAGVGRRVDFEQAAGRQALAESNLIVEISNLHDVSARFQRLVGEAPAKEMEAPTLLSQSMPTTINQALATSYSLNPQVRAAVENVRASAYARDARRGAYQPKVEFRLREDRGSDLNGYVGNTNNRTAEVLFNFNIFNGFGDVGRVDQSIGLYNAARDQRDKACRDVRQTLEIAYNDVRKLVEQKNYLEQHRLSVEKARDAYRKQFDIGQRSLLDLLDTENELFQARRSEVNADLDLATAYARVHAGEGKLLQVLGLTTVKSELSTETKDWKLGEESPEQCPPDPVLTYVSNKELLNGRATEMTRDKVKVMLDAIAARQQSGGSLTNLDSSIPVVIAPLQSIEKQQIVDKKQAIDKKQSFEPTQGVEKNLEIALDSWVNDWISRDIPAYLGRYSPTFLVAEGSRRAAWIRDRKLVISKCENIKIKLSNVKVELRDATHASTRFHQHYSANNYADEVEKVLEWELIDGKWLIIGEIGAPSSKRITPAH